jgi:hypothetical protein
MRGYVLALQVRPQLLDAKLDQGILVVRRAHENSTRVAPLDLPFLDETVTAETAVAVGTTPLE